MLNESLGVLRQNHPTSEVMVSATGSNWKTYTHQLSFKCTYF